VTRRFHGIFQTCFDLNSSAEDITAINIPILREITPHRSLGVDVHCGSDSGGGLRAETPHSGSFLASRSRNASPKSFRISIITSTLLIFLGLGQDSHETINNQATILPHTYPVT